MLMKNRILQTEAGNTEKNKNYSPQRAQRTQRKDLKRGWFTLAGSVICLIDNLACPIQFLYFNEPDPADP
ncbi:hypothetical protein GARC_2394 [Paraglaciecola arctica BSs20135]|uniref:Uncharacterized protein n=1 Tax=Paraglaciecola arctica BSs20135 TaxID=493475 RepID=K6Z7E8_9ALTE|nr:hypothetical protein GARC_2394 [Paraglaciecola arctica BSs20135]